MDGKNGGFTVQNGDFNGVTLWLKVYIKLWKDPPFYS